MKEWEVYFDGNLWGHKKGGSRCREIPVEKTFYWGEEKWRIPDYSANVISRQPLGSEQ